MENLKLALLGFGNAGQAFCRLLLEKQDKTKKQLNPWLNSDKELIYLSTVS